MEKLRWMKRRIGEATEGKQRLSTGMGFPLMVKMEEDCQAALYLAMVKNKQTGMYHVDVKGYLRTFSGYCDKMQLRRLCEEISRLSLLVGELEEADISVEEHTLLAFSKELECLEADMRWEGENETDSHEWQGS